MADETRAKMPGDDVRAQPRPNDTTPFKTPSYTTGPPLYPEQAPRRTSGWPAHDISGVITLGYKTLHSSFVTTDSLTTCRFSASGISWSSTIAPQPVTVTMSLSGICSCCGGSGIARTLSPLNEVLHFKTAKSLVTETSSFCS